LHAAADAATSTLCEKKLAGAHCAAVDDQLVVTRELARRCCQGISMFKPAVPSKINYRADVDGLRALAVLLVMAFHLHPGLPHGGFVGVDIFFVISGYLITQILHKEITAGSFSILNFYERRIRRIFPALLAVLVACSIAASITMMPGELIAFGKSLLAATLSYSNLLFWSQTGYFDGPAAAKPLLHTWSLAVEEQFYIVFPLLLYFIHRRAAHLLRWIILALALGSLAISSMLAYSHSTAAFYMPYARAWELLTGAILSLGMVPAIRGRLARELAALLGLGLIAVAALHYSSETPFPGLAALLPCIGTALIIAAGTAGKTLVGRALSVRPVVFIGLISYSVYLWHWPLIVFVRLAAPDLSADGYPYLLAMTSVSLIAGALSWRFVELPARRGRLRAISRRGVFVLGGASVALMSAVAGVAVASNGLDSRFPARAISVAAFADAPQQMRLNVCFIAATSRLADYDKSVCLHRASGLKNYLLLGDSHSAALWYGLAHEVPGVNILQASFAGCPPIIGTNPKMLCGKLAKYLFNDYLPRSRIDGIIFSARWSNPREFDSLNSTITWAAQRGIPVTIIGPVPEYDMALPKLLAYGIRDNDRGLAARHLQTNLVALDQALAEKASRDWQVRYVSLFKLLCDDSGCPEYADSARGIPFLVDGDHLTNAASSVVARKLVAQGTFLPGNRTEPTVADLGSPVAHLALHTAAGSSGSGDTARGRDNQPTQQD
jgi:peptidoglycan/LPS O-acetylase OafA/YrhL